MELPETPKLTVDAVVYFRGRIVIIERKFPPLGLAVIGGFVDVGESCEQAAIREVKEETGLDVWIRGLIGVFSDPERDERGHLVSVAYLAEADDRGRIVPQDEEIKSVKAYSESELLGELGYQLVIDHRRILLAGIALKEQIQW